MIVHRDLGVKIWLHCQSDPFFFGNPISDVRAPNDGENIKAKVERQNQGGPP